MRLLQAHVLYSGADDSMFRGWDLRCDTPALFSDRCGLNRRSTVLASRCLTVDAYINSLVANVLHQSYVEHRTSA